VISCTIDWQITVEPTRSRKATTQRHEVQVERANGDAHALALAHNLHEQERKAKALASGAERDERRKYKVRQQQGSARCDDREDNVDQTFLRVLLRESQSILRARLNACHYIRDNHFILRDHKDSHQLLDED
jgi:hypothetical protein